MKMVTVVIAIWCLLVDVTWSAACNKLVRRKRCENSGCIWYNSFCVEATGLIQPTAQPVYDVQSELEAMNDKIIDQGKQIRSLSTNINTIFVTEQQLADYLAGNQFVTRQNLTDYVVSQITLPTIEQQYNVTTSINQLQNQYDDLQRQFESLKKDMYTRSEVDQLLSSCLKTSDAATTYATKTQLSNYAPSTSVPSSYAAKSHTHSEYAPTPSLSSYSPTSHTHSEYAPTPSLSSYAPSTTVPSYYSPTSHSHPNYSPTSHSHPNYSPTSHSHPNYSPSYHSHPNYSPTSHSHSNYVSQSSLANPTEYCVEHGGEITMTSIYNSFCYLTFVKFDDNGLEADNTRNDQWCKINVSGSNWRLVSHESFSYYTVRCWARCITF